MAKAPAKPEAEAQEEEAAPAPRRGKKMLIIILAVVLLVVIAGGGVAYMLLSKKDKHEEEPKDDTPPKITVDKSKPPTFVPLESFTVNLQPGEGDHYLQAMIVLKVSDPKIADDLKVYMPEIRHRVNLLLSSKLPSEIASIEGREVLAEEVMIETNYVLGYEPPGKKARGGADDEPWGPVLAVLFNSFIVQ